MVLVGIVYIRKLCPILLVCHINILYCNHVMPQPEEEIIEFCKKKKGIRLFFILFRTRFIRLRTKKDVYNQEIKHS